MKLTAFTIIVLSIIQVLEGTSLADSSEQPKPPQLVAKLDWTLLTTGGGGGALGIEFDQFEIGVLGLVTPLPDLYRDIFLSGAEEHDLTLNWGAEIYFQWYPKLTRNWLFVGGLVSFDGFKLDLEGETSTLYAAYAAPRVGLRIDILDWLFFEPSIGAAVRVWDSSLGDDSATVRARPIAPITFLSIGGALPL